MWEYFQVGERVTRTGVKVTENSVLPGWKTFWKNVFRHDRNFSINTNNLRVLQEPTLTHNRKVSKSQKDETLYVAYVRSRELYQVIYFLLIFVIIAYQKKVSSNLSF